MNKYDYIYNEIKTKLGTVDSTFNANKYPLTYVRISDDDTNEIINYEFGWAKNYDRTILVDLFYQNKYSTNTENEQVILNSLNDKSDELELLLTTGSFENEYIHKVSNIETYRIKINGIKLLMNARAVQNNIGMLWIQFEINYNQNFK